MSHTTARASCWSLTINNPTPEDEECINLARQRGWIVEGQLEKGENGTPHYQLMVKTPQVRFSAVKRAFPRGHIEVARNAAALRKYVHKDQSREGELPTQQEMYPSLVAFWRLVLDYFLSQEKDGLDYIALADGHVKFYKDEIDAAYRKEPTLFFRAAVNNLIERGYMVESIAVNPATLSMWKHHRNAILVRAYRQSLQETASQTDTESVQSADVDFAQVNITADGHQDVSSPPPPPPPCPPRTNAARALDARPPHV